MGQVLVLVDVDAETGADADARDGTVRRSASVLLTIARRLGEPVAVYCGARELTKAAISTLSKFGAVEICTAGRERPPTQTGSNSVERALHTLATLAEHRRPTAIFIAAGYSGQEIAGRLAVRLAAGVITDAVDVRSGPEGPIAVQSCLAHSYLVESRVRRGVPVITVRPDAAVPVPVEASTAPRIVSVPVPADAFTRAPRIRAMARPRRDHQPPLASADVVVAGGRGLGSAESFRLLAELAGVLGGAVGGSHTATELGWCQPEQQIGLTGTTVRPRLYLASGISGSVRHRAGMQGAKTVVVIGDDPAAPLFRLADLGVVGDLHEVLPALLAEITRRRARRSPGSLGVPRTDRDLTEA
jgi:electron transfer flavoprotein alpha subunit